MADLERMVDERGFSAVLKDLIGIADAQEERRDDGEWCAISTNLAQGLNLSRDLEKKIEAESHKEKPCTQ